MTAAVSWRYVDVAVQGWWIETWQQMQSQQSRRKAKLQYGQDGSMSSPMQHGVGSSQNEKQNAEPPAKRTQALLHNPIQAGFDP